MIAILYEPRSTQRRRKGFIWDAKLCLAVLCKVHVLFCQVSGDPVRLSESVSATGMACQSGLNIDQLW